MYSVTNGVPVLDFGPGEGRLILENGRLSMPITNRIHLDSRNRVTNLSSNKLTLSIATSSGLFHGQLTPPETNKPISFSGAVLQKQNRGSGFFLNGSQSG